MSELSWSDAELAEYLEGLLDPDVAEALAAEAELDEALAARLAALGAILAEPVRLPELAPPPVWAAELPARLLARPSDAALAEALEGEGDLAALERDPARAGALRATLAAASDRLPRLAPPPGLLGRTLARLEHESLCAAGPSEELPDPTLAALLEGALSPAEAERAELALGRSPAARARLSALAASLPREARLPALTPPAGLGAALGARLRAEGLLREPLEPALLAAPARDLAARTLERLEAQGLVAAAGGAQQAAPEGAVLSFPRWLPAAAAALLVGLGLGAGGLAAVGRGEATASAARLATAEAAAAALEERLRREERELARARSETDEARGSAREARAAAERLGDELRGREQELARLGARGQEGERLARELELATAELRAAREAAAHAQGTTSELRATLAGRAQELAQARSELRASEQALGAVRAARLEAETQRELAQVELERLRALPAGRALAVQDAAGVERWDADRREWRPLRAGERVAPGELLRGALASSTLQVSGLLPFQLRSGVYVVRDEQRLDPLPAEPWGGTAEPAPTPRPDDVQAWIERLQSDTPWERSQAQRALCAQFELTGGVGAPPTSAEGWARWWGQAARPTRR